MAETNGLTWQPLTKEKWRDFESLFGKNGACGGCWCMFFLLPGKEFQASKGDPLHQMMQIKVCEDQQIPGLIAYHHEIPAGWIAVGPREQYVRLQNSRILKPVDDLPVWSIVCFYVGKKYRRMGVNLFLINAAIQYARDNGAKIIEAYPYEPQKSMVPDVFAFTGFQSTFTKAEFVEVARRSPTRPIMRYDIGKSLL